MLSRVRNLWFDSPRLRRYLPQVLFLAAVFAIIAGSLTNIYVNVVRQGMAYGWEFLGRATGWQLSVSMLPQSLTDPYWWTILMGMVNTVALGLLCIVSATVIGSIIGLLRLSGNLVVRSVTTVYVDILRNVPVILQIYFWYEVCRHAPIERQALSIGGTFFVSNRGFYFPALQVEPGQGLPLLGLILLLAVATWLLVRLSRRLELLLVWALALSIYFVWLKNPVSLHIPAMQGFGFRGGNRMPVEFLALFLAITLYSSAYIAEIVRGGLLSVPVGQREAALSLGLTAWQSLRYVVVPQSLRAILPPLGSWYLNTVKNSSLAVAIAYPDLVSVVDTLINQTGQAIEGVAIIVGGIRVTRHVVNRYRMRLEAAARRSVPTH